MGKRSISLGREKENGGGRRDRRSISGRASAVQKERAALVLPRDDGGWGERGGGLRATAGEYQTRVLAAGGEPTLLLKGLRCWTRCSRGSSGIEKEVGHAEGVNR